MRNKILFIAVILFVLAACGKDKFKTEPQIEIKSISPSTVFSGDIISMKGKYTDDEGDLDTVFIVYKWYNGTTIVRADTARYPASLLRLPENTRESDVIMNFEYNTSRFQNTMVSLPGVPRDTTAAFGMILKDKAGHRSVYSESDQIRLKKP